MNTTEVPHPIYFLVRRTDERGRANLTAIKDESPGKRFACVFVSFQDAEEFMVANDLTFDTWKISEAHRAPPSYKPAATKRCVRAATGL